MWAFSCVKAHIIVIMDDIHINWFRGVINYL